MTEQSFVQINVSARPRVKQLLDSLADETGWPKTRVVEAALTAFSESSGRADPRYSWVGEMLGKD